MPAEAVKRARRAYFGACSYIDANIGKLVKILNDCGLGDDTIIVFSGDHGLWYKMHWFEMSARVPMVIHAPSRFAALAGGHQDSSLPLDGRSLMPHLEGATGHDEVIGEYMGEGTNTPLVMIRRGDYKFIHSQQDPCLLFNLQADPQELINLSELPEHRALLDAFLAEAAKRWDLPALHAQVLASQRRRRFVGAALAKGKLTSWDHQPKVDASQQYMRNHIDLDDLEKRARFPLP